MKEPQQKAQACIIWMHGLGADSSDMMGLAEQLPAAQLPIRHVFIDAPMRPVTLNAGMMMPAWYDILGMELTDREDGQGIAQSARLISEVLDEQIKDGFEAQQIFLAGFSQGGAMALHTALHYSGRLAGVIALSAYLPVARETQAELDKTTSFFIASGRFDPIVLPLWTQKSKEWLLTSGYEAISYHEYPMEHSVCFEELRDLGLWITQQLQGAV